jgi:hypothetical protein
MKPCWKSAVVILVLIGSACQSAKNSGPASTTSTAETPAKEPTSGFLLVGNSGSSGVRRFDLKSGKARGYFIEPDAGGLAFPDDITAGPDSNLYVSSGCRTTPGVPCNKSISAVLRYDGRSGAFLGTFISGASSDEPLYRPYGTVFGPDGLFYVASFMSNQILRYRSDGTFVDVFAASHGKDPEGLNGPNGLAFDGDGRLYVSTEGDTIDCPGRPQQGDCSPTFSKGYPSLLLRYDLETGKGSVFAQPKGTDGLAPSLAGIRLGPDGLLYVGDFSMNVIRVYDPATGKEIRMIPTAGPGMCTAALEQPYTGYFVFEDSGALLVAVGSQSKGVPGRVLRLMGERYGESSCLVGPTGRLDRPMGVALRP